MARGRRYFGRQRDASYQLLRGDQMGFTYPPLPPGGSRQVLGTMSTDPRITPAIPTWLPKRHYNNWATIWRSRPKQYKAPGSKELIPWDTTHMPMGDYQGEDEYYVPGCFGYDKKGNEIMYRPGLPGVHIWRGRGLALAPAPERPEPAPQEYTVFKFYNSAIPYTQEELNDLQIGTPASLSQKESSCEAIGFSEDTIDLDTSAGLFKDNCCSASSPDNTSSLPSSSIADILSGTESFVSTISTTQTSVISSSHQTASLITIPGEIRNQIYGYLLEESNDYEIVWCSRGKDLMHYKHKMPLDKKGVYTGWHYLAKFDPKLDDQFDRPIKDTKGKTARRLQARRIYSAYNREERVEEFQSAGPAAFLLTCKRIYQEAMPLFYQKHTFSFSSRSLLHTFMNKVSPTALANIGTLYLAHNPQGWPLKTKDAVLVEKEYAFWIRDLQMMVQSFTGLRELVMLLHIRDPHINNAERAEWAMGLRRGLAGLKYNKKLEHFDLKVRYGCDTSNMAWARIYGNALQKERGQDLEDLVCIVKSKIFAMDDQA